MASKKAKRREPVWTAADRKRAHEQGWDIFDTGSRGLEIEAVDEYGVFEDDNQAEDYVFRQAERGCKTAQKALAIVSAIKVYHVKVSLAVNLNYLGGLSRSWNERLWKAVQERVAAGDEHDVENVVVEDVTLAESLEED